jgi:hypothetical protein
MSTPRASRILLKTHFVQLGMGCVLFILFIARLILRTQGVGINYADPTAGGGPASGWGTGVVSLPFGFDLFDLAHEEADH